MSAFRPGWRESRWALPLVASLVGLAMTSVGLLVAGLALSFVANTVLLGRAHDARRRQHELSDWRQALARRMTFLGAGIILVAAALEDAEPWSPARRALIVAMTSGAQLFLVGRSIDPTHDANQRGRLLMPLLGHAVILLASSLLLFRPAMARDHGRPRLLHRVHHGASPRVLGGPRLDRPRFARTRHRTRTDIPRSPRHQPDTARDRFFGRPRNAPRRQPPH